MFNRTQWFGIHVLWRTVAYTLAQWRILLLKEEERGKLLMMVSKLEFLARMPPLLSGWNLVDSREEGEDCTGSMQCLSKSVHPGYAEAGCNCFPQSNKASFIEKKWGATGWE
jgi:hypothetical protein